MMATYQQRLKDFADGKHLVRLSRPLRDRADASCDACGSNKPRVLFALKDEDAGRYYFVGDTCISNLMHLGVVLKGFGKESAIESYQAEMERRGREATDATRPSNDREPVSASSQSASSGESDEPSTIESVRGSPMVPLVVVVETPQCYRSYVGIVSAEGAVRSYGFAQEDRRWDVWSRTGERSVLLEKVTVDREEALQDSVVKAWHNAATRLGDSGQISSSLNGTDVKNEFLRGILHMLEVANNGLVPAVKSNRLLADAPIRR